MGIFLIAESIDARDAKQGERMMTEKDHRNRRRPALK
jgi:hypothetical protein